jgi:hypothetical protein
LFFLKQATNALYGCVDKALPRVVEAVQQLEKLIKSFFPGMQALKMTPETQPEATGHGRYAIFDRAFLLTMCNYGGRFHKLKNVTELRRFLDQAL